MSKNCKKQKLIFAGVNKYNNQPFAIGDFEIAVSIGKQDPVALNRKSRKAMIKKVKGLINEEQKLSATTLRNEAKTKHKKKSKTYLSKRFNNLKRRLR